MAAYQGVHLFFGHSSVRTAALSFAYMRVPTLILRHNETQSSISVSAIVCYECFVLNHDPHAGWEMLPMALFGASWLIAQMYLTVNTEEARAGKIISPPPWLNSLLAMFLFSSCLGNGVVILADRLTQHWPDFFPLAYIGLLAAFLAPVWIWHPEKDKKLTWRKTSILILYAVPATFILALSFKKGDPVTSSHLWFIPILIVATFLVIAGMAKKENRRQCVIASLWIGGIVG